jgi:DegV family protein with EDD domain
VDSKSVSAGLFLLALHAAESATRGTAVETVLADIERDIKKVAMYFVVDTLEYLQRGGRIGAAAQIIGSMPNVKPILTLRDGVIASASRARSRRRAFDRVIELLSALPYKPAMAVVGHAIVPDEAKKLDAMIRDKFGRIRIYTCPIGPVIGTHSGPGCVEVGVI